MNTRADPPAMRKFSDWALTVLTAIVVGFSGWTVQQVSTIAEALRLTTLQVAVNKENLDQLHTQVNRREDRDDTFTREAIRGLETRIEKLEDRARTH